MVLHTGINIRKKTVERKLGETGSHEKEVLQNNDLGWEAVNESHQ
jgi:hypothetical protein